MRRSIACAGVVSCIRLLDLAVIHLSKSDTLCTAELLDQTNGAALQLPVGTVDFLTYNPEPRRASLLKRHHRTIAERLPLGHAGASVDPSNVVFSEYKARSEVVHQYRPAGEPPFDPRGFASIAREVRRTVFALDDQAPGPRFRTPGHHLWADRYDRESQREIFALQDEITKKILTELQVKLTVGEQARLYGRGTDNLEAYIKVLQGREYYWRLDREGNIMARKLFEEAIALDPKYPAPYWLLGTTHIVDAWFDWGKSKEDSLARAIELAQKTISLDDLDSNAHGMLGAAYRLKGNHDKAIAEGKRAVELDPNSADAHVWLGIALNYADRAEEAIPLFEKAIRLNPFAHTWYFLHLGHAYRFLRRYDEAIATYQKAIQLSPKNLIAHLGLTCAYSLSGRDKEASAHAKEILRISPDFSLDRFAEKLTFKNQAEKERYINALRKAGLK